MSNTYTGANGKTYITEAQPLGKGGEGEAYRIHGNPDLVLQLYLPSYRTEGRHRKLLAMIQSSSKSDALRQQTTWPVDVVYDNGSFVGYVMPLVSGVKTLNEIYSDNDVYSLSEKIVIAKNLCAAVHSIHQAGQVIGDFNPNIICFEPNTGLVTLIVTDSYHITDNEGRIYRCGFAIPEFTAKELQDKLKYNKTLSLHNLPLPTFTKETDLFALAIHIFTLLMNGCHPFASAVDSIVIASRTSVVNPQPFENIRNGFFPFYIKKAGYTIPQYAPDFSVLPKAIRDLFVKAFVDGSANPSVRPSALEWYEALSEFEKHLKHCSINNRHEFFDQLITCPWCELEKRYNNND